MTRRIKTWMDTCMNKRIKHKCKHGWTNEWTNKWKQNEQANEQLNEKSKLKYGKKECEAVLGYKHKFLSTAGRLGRSRSSWGWGSRRPPCGGEIWSSYRPTCGRLSIDWTTRSWFDVWNRTAPRFDLFMLSFRSSRRLKCVYTWAR